MNSPFSLTVATLLVSGACLTAATPTRGDHLGPQDPIRAIPATSYAAARFAGLEACTHAAETLPLVRWIEQVAAPGRKQADAAARRIWARVDARLRDIGLDRKVLQAVLRRPVAAGVGRLTFFKDQPVPSFAVALDVTGHESKIRGALERIGELLREHRGLEYEISLDRGGQRDGVGFTWLNFTHPRLGGHMAAVLGDGLLLLGNSPGYLRDCVESWRGRSRSIARLDIAKHGVGRLGTAPILSIVVNPPSIARLLPYEVTDVIAALGLEGVAGAFYCAGVHEGRSCQVSCLATADLPTGVVAAFLPSPAGRIDALGYCPPDTLAYASGEVDGALFVESVSRALRALPRSARRDLERDLLEELGGKPAGVPASLLAMGHKLGATKLRWTIAGTMPSVRSLVPEGLLFIRPDPERAVTPEQLGDALEAVLLDANQTVRRARFRELELRYFKIENARVQLAPAFVVHDGRLVVASDVRALKAALARRMDGRSILDRGGPPDGYAAVVCGIPVSSTVHIRTRLVIEAFWPLLEGVLQSLPDDFEGAEMLDLDALPEVDELLEAVTDIRFGAHRHAKGVDWLGESTIGVGSVLAFFGAWLDELLGLPGRAKVG